MKSWLDDGSYRRFIEFHLGYSDYCLILCWLSLSSSSFPSLVFHVARIHIRHWGAIAGARRWGSGWKIRTIYSITFNVGGVAVMNRGARLEAHGGQWLDEGESFLVFCTWKTYRSTWLSRYWMVSLLSLRTWRPCTARPSDHLLLANPAIQALLDCMFGLTPATGDSWRNVHCLPLTDHSKSHCPSCLHKGHRVIHAWLGPLGEWWQHENRRWEPISQVERCSLYWVSMWTDVNVGFVKAGADASDSAVRLAHDRSSLLRQSYWPGWVLPFNYELCYVQFLYKFLISSIYSPLFHSVITSYVESLHVSPSFGFLQYWYRGWREREYVSFSFPANHSGRYRHSYLNLRYSKDVERFMNDVVITQRKRQ